MRVNLINRIYGGMFGSLSSFEEISLPRSSTHYADVIEFYVVREP